MMDMRQDGRRWAVDAPLPALGGLNTNAQPTPLCNTYQLPLQGNQGLTLAVFLSQQPAVAPVAGSPAGYVFVDFRAGMDVADVTVGSKPLAAFAPENGLPLMGYELPARGIAIHAGGPFGIARALTAAASRPVRVRGVLYEGRPARTFVSEVFEVAAATAVDVRIPMFATRMSATVQGIGASFGVYLDSWGNPLVWAVNIGADLVGIPAGAASVRFTETGGINPSQIGCTFEVIA